MESWHRDFNPSKFLERVDLDKFLVKNYKYHEIGEQGLSRICTLCGRENNHGLTLSNKAFLCKVCFDELSTTSYPEKYEKMRIEFLVKKEARELAFAEFSARFSHQNKDNYFYVLGFLSLILMIFNVWFVVISIALFLIATDKNEKDKISREDWRQKQKVWLKINPELTEQPLLHFHDPLAELSEKDQKILEIFDHWPSYPPYWKYLREVVLKRDSYRCQVTGCPSRLELHIHHITPISQGGKHSPSNLVSLCDFHHALEPDKGHERIWERINTRYFTIVPAHMRSNPNGTGFHAVKAHLRRLELVTLEEVESASEENQLKCKLCESTELSHSFSSDRRVLLTECRTCCYLVKTPMGLAEEVLPILAESFIQSKNKGVWVAKWQMLEGRKAEIVHNKRDLRAEKTEIKAYKTALINQKKIPNCPTCGAPMRLVKPKPNDSWSAFWGCRQYSISGCKGYRKLT